MNKVHRRAYNYPVDAPSEVDYRSLSDRTRTVDATDHLANDPLLYELWAEVFGEMRWWEYVRLLDLGEKEKDYYKTISGPGSSKTNIVWKETNYAHADSNVGVREHPQSGHGPDPRLLIAVRYLSERSLRM